jgi:DNA repair exonuclease SbcCD ATPase subunit
MSAHLDLDDVASGNPLAEEELKNLRDNADWSSDKIIQLAKENADMRAELEKLEAKLEGWIQKYIELKFRHSNRRAALDEMREALEHMHKYILSTSSASLRADAFQKYPKAGKMFREIEGLLEKYPKE